MDLKPKWIWYYGDYEIYHSNLLNSRREAYGDDYPAFISYPNIHMNVGFVREYEFSEETAFRVKANGKFQVRVDNKPQRAQNEIYTLPAGKHTLIVYVCNTNGLPAVFVYGEKVVSDESWQVSDRTWECVSVGCVPEYHSPDDMYLMGTRKGEALALTWQDVDFERQEVRINKSLNRKKPEQGMEIILASDPTPSSMGWHILNGRSYEITTPKNITSNRKVWMTELVVKTLKDLRTESERDYDFAETDFVFGGKLPLSDQTVRRRMDQYADKAGIKRIRVHDLRHSHASLVISKGLKIEDLILLSKRLGHRDVKETLNTYSHLFPNAQRKILESIDEGAEM